MFARLSFPCGTLLIAADHGALVYCNWDTHEVSNSLQRKLKEASCSEIPEDRNVIEQTLMQMEEYLSGNLQNFQLPVHLVGTEFQKQVWQELLKIPYSSTISYKELATRIGNPKGVRAVAQACGANPLAIIIPCHRVVGSAGRIGGYSGGLDKKIWLLNHEIFKNL